MILERSMSRLFKFKKFSEYFLNPKNIEGELFGYNKNIYFIKIRKILEVRGNYGGIYGV